MAGVNRAAYYNYLVRPGSTHQVAVPANDGPVVTEPDFAKNDDIHAWLIEPADLQKKLYRVRGTGKKLELDKRSRRVGFKDSGNSTVKQAIIDWIKEPIQHRRANLLGHRRPKAVGYAGFTVYFWHAPLGGDTRLNVVGMDDHSDVAGLGSGGELAGSPRTSCSAST